MKRFYTTDDQIFNRVKILEDSILREIPPFIKSSVKIFRRQQVWNTTDGTEFVNSVLSDNRNWIIAGWDKDNTYYNYPLMYNNSIISTAGVCCPKTIGVLQKLGNISIAGFSLLTPKSQLPVHSDATGPSFGSVAINMKIYGGKSQLHMKVPDKEDILIHTHKSGKAVIFNSENQHYATNLDYYDRVILYVNLKVDHINLSSLE
jgi:hypothetical protein